MQIQPYLFFDGRCEEAIAYYREALSAELVMLMHYSDGPEGTEGCAGDEPPPPDKVMHACLQVGQTQLLASDGFAGGNPEFKGISLSIAAADDAEAKRLFDALADGGQVQQPLAETFFATSFGMVADRFGVSWMIVAGKPQAG
ncbi:3-demethylubiquinone-9 3-methyltransferase [Frateuria sp. Soil773]|uniref:VOC family protein n=1 Tax=Frateuria sp. Soil773 TaxID=1736407 RepID=UPI0006F5789F|nr:VOC family protein [Frateuria sp. Soil773]KRE92518.1 3-demethylubiquinone-9 3-methyltransferase [Frateuria sp. Soil773]